ncbi:MAG: hypothetical protein J7M10_07835, partial [Candidatus Cloacimonetes bacterium]|nr:hypothetical protein [Candidatus Cloacimonadota bacterium]
MISLVLCSFAFAEENSSTSITPNGIEIKRSCFFSGCQSNVLISTMNKEGNSINDSQSFFRDNTKTFNKRTKDSFIYLKASPFLLYGGSFGFGKFYLHKKRMQEDIWFFHYHKWKGFLATGILFQYNNFISKSREGFFWLANGGVDYTIREPLIDFGNPGGPNTNDSKKTKYKGLFPNIALGCGISTKIPDSSYLRISLDVGIKILVVNLNISYCF